MLSPIRAAPEDLALQTGLGRAAIDCATDGCERLHTEVFRSVTLESGARRADAFFSVMPSPTSVSEDDEGEPSEDQPAVPPSIDTVRHDG